MNKDDFDCIAAINTKNKTILDLENEIIEQKKLIDQLCNLIENLNKIISIIEKASSK